MVLIGCKTDLRKDKEQLRKLRAAQLEPITYLQVSQAPRPPPLTLAPWPGAQACGHCNWGALVASGTTGPKRILRMIMKC